MLRKVWIELRSSLWFVPSVLVVVGIVAALGLIELDISYDAAIALPALRPLLASSSEGARSMLAAIATSMITVAGVAFSITIVTLSLASTQYTPRILRNFMGDRANQAVLGIFVAIFTYCVIVLRSIRSPAEGAPFVPLLAVFFGVLLALLSIGCLIFFIHHVAASIQASYIMAAISAETVKAMDALFPDSLDPDQPEVAKRQDGREWHAVTSPASGYVQGINTSGLEKIAEAEKIRVRLDRVPGDFATEGAPLLSTDRPIDDRIGGTLRRTYTIGDFRTLEQDPGFGVRQIVDIAMKALSPGVNDTSTAVTCIDYLGALLFRLAPRRITPLIDREHVSMPVATFRDVLNKSFDEIRLSANGNVTILLQLMCALQRIGRATMNDERRASLGDQLRHIRETADASVLSSYDRARINHELTTTRETLRVAHETVPDLSATKEGGGHRL